MHGMMINVLNLAASLPHSSILARTSVTDDWQASHRCCLESIEVATGQRMSQPYRSLTRWSDRDRAAILASLLVL